MNGEYAKTKRRNDELLKEDIRRRRGVFQANPRILICEPTNRCNLHCGLCARNNWDQSLNPPADMSLETLDLLTPFFKSAQSVYAFGHGEPTMGENFRRIISRAKECDCQVQFTTNGSRLGEELIDDVIEMDVDVVNVSLDALEPAASQKRRGVDSREVLRWLHRVWEKKVAAGKRKPETGVAFTADRYNLGELKNLVDSLAAVGSSILIVSHLVAWTPENHFLSAYHTGEDFREAFREAAMKGKAGGINVILPFQNLTDGRCPHPMTMFFVRSNGEAWPCCNAVFRQNRYSFPAGNVHESPLRDIWNSDVYQALRRGWFDDNPPAHCRICPLANDNLESHLRTLG